MDFTGRIRESQLKGRLLALSIDEAQATETYRFNLENSVSVNLFKIQDALKQAHLAVGRWESEDNYVLALFAEIPRSPSHVELPEDETCKEYGIGSKTRLKEFCPGGYFMLNLYGKGKIGDKELAPR